MWRQFPMIVVSALGLLASGVGLTHAPATVIASVHSHASIAARAGAHQPVGGVGASSRAIATTPAALRPSPSSDTRVAPATLLRGKPSAPSALAVPTTGLRHYTPSGATGNAMRRHAPVNTILGGPASFDPRKLVRR
jgi:hypothetical protein